MSLGAKFKKAAKDVTKLPTRPKESTLLELYSLYKQATEGDVTGERPGLMNLNGRLKYDARAKKEGLSKQEAMGAYVGLVEKLLKE